MSWNSTLLKPKPALKFLGAFLTSTFTEQRQHTKTQ